MQNLGQLVGGLSLGWSRRMGIFPCFLNFVIELCGLRFRCTCLSALCRSVALVTGCYVLLESITACDVYDHRACDLVLPVYRMLRASFGDLALVGFVFAAPSARWKLSLFG